MSNISSCQTVKLMLAYADQTSVSQIETVIYAVRHDKATVFITIIDLINSMQMLSANITHLLNVRIVFK